ncbi:MAG TPA: hypothetical protein VHW45_05320 [Candidatus Sulfotelmatobacter sp.]|jgi:hypothetical protein|nr:hypothetical protein [Candidatus Sulfotelmatobacter sp.]
MTKMRDVVELLKKEHTRLTKQIDGVTAALAAFGNSYRNGNEKRTISAAGRARIAAAQKARWAKQKAKAGTPKKRVMSAAARKRIAAAQRARWAKIKAKS